MRSERIDKAKAMGADLRALRKTRGLTLAGLADRTGRSVGWLSQVERDISDLSSEDLNVLSAALDAPVSMLLQKGNTEISEADCVVRAKNRRRIDRNINGLVEELLSPDLTDDFEVVHSTFAAGASRTDPVRRPTQELGYVISGQMDLNIGNRNFTVGPGDSFRVRNEPFTWSNPYATPCVAVWVIAPPVY